MNILLIGLDEGAVGGPWAMKQGGATAVQGPETVVVDDLYRGRLGVDAVGQELELIGERAVVGGFSRGIRSLTASTWVFTSIETAIRYDKRYRVDEVTYVLVRSEPGRDPGRVRDAFASRLPNVEVLTSREFAIRTMRNWLLDTGLGATVVVTAVLRLVVGAFVMSQTLVALTQEHLAHYATLISLGFSPARLTSIILTQGLILAGCGLAIGTQVFFLARSILEDTPIPMETTPPIFGSLRLVWLAGCFLASFASIRSIFRIDPITVFRV